MAERNSSQLGLDPPAVIGTRIYDAREIVKPERLAYRQFRGYCADTGLVQHMSRLRADVARPKS